ncbi:hypothetical protein D3C81_637610 [compost metagenome]
MPEKDPADQRDDDELFDELVAEVFHRAVDQLAAVVGGDDFHPGRQTAFQFVEFGLDRCNGLASVLAAAQNHHAADGLAFAVEFGDATAHFRSRLNRGDIAKGHRNTARAQLERDCPKVIERFQVAGRAHNELGLCHLQHRATGFLIGLADSVGHLSLSDAEAGQFQRVQLHLVLLDHPPHGGHFRHVGQGLEFELEKPVLKRAQLRQVVSTTAIHQCVLVDPAHSRRIRPQRRLGAGRQPALYLAQVLQHPRASPVQVRAVFEQHVNEAVAEEGVTTHGSGARHREHGGGQRIGHLILDNLRRLSCIRGADDHLHIREIWQCINGGSLHRPDTPSRDEQRRQ